MHNYLREFVKRPLLLLEILLVLGTYFDLLEQSVGDFFTGTECRRSLHAIVNQSFYY
jgi:hypothetical protein